MKRKSREELEAENRHGEYLAGCSDGMPPESIDEDDYISGAKCVCCKKDQKDCKCSDEEIEEATNEIE